MTSFVLLRLRHLNLNRHMNIKIYIKVECLNLNIKMYKNLNTK